MVFQADKPIQVAQFANGSAFYGQSKGDPCMILLPPVGHYLTSYIVAVPEGFGENYLNLIVPTAAKETTSIDGVTVSASSFTAIGNSGYWGAQIGPEGVTTGTHTVTSSAPIEVQVYGFGDADTYGYLGGLIP